MRHGTISRRVTWMAAFAALQIFAAGAFGADRVAVSDLTLVGIAETDGVTYVSLVDAQTGQRFLPSTRAADNGLELVGIRDDEEAIVRQDGRSFLLRLNWPAGTVANVAATAAVQAANVPRPGSEVVAGLTPPPGGKVPLVFQSGDLSKLNLTDAQKAIIYNLRQQFLAAIGGAKGAGGATSSTSASLAATSSAPATGDDGGATSAVNAQPQAVDWPSAQEQSDETFRMLFGYQAFNAYEMQMHAQPPVR